MINRKDFPLLLKNLKLLNKGVEVGSFKGEFAKIILNSWPGTLFLVDVWRDLDDKEYDDASNMKFHGSTFADAIKKLEGLEKRALMVRMESEQAVDLFEDNSLDFVYIDANHNYESAKKDIEIWFPKVKNGGVFSGHDYLLSDCFNQEEYDKGNKDQHMWMWMDGNVEEKFYAGVFGVNPAVDEFVKEKNYSLNLTDEWTSTWWFIK